MSSSTRYIYCLGLSYFWHLMTASQDADSNTTPEFLQNQLNVKRKMLNLKQILDNFLSIVKYLWGVSPIFSHCCIYFIYISYHQVPVLTRAIIPQCSRCWARVQLFTPSVFIMAALVLRNDEFIQFYPPKQQLCRSIVSTGARAAAAWFKYFYVLISIKAAAAVSADGALCNWLSRGSAAATPGSDVMVVRAANQTSRKFGMTGEGQ